MLLLLISIAEYLVKVSNMNEISDRRKEIIKVLLDEKVDYRTLNHFRNKLFENQNQQDKKLSLEFYLSVKNQVFGDKLQKVEELILEEIKVINNKGLKVNLG